MELLKKKLKIMYWAIPHHLMRQQNLFEVTQSTKMS